MNHTNFNPSTFTAGAVGGSLTLAGAFIGAVQAAAELNTANQWARYDRGQLQKILNVSELLREHAVRRAERAEAELDALNRLALKRVGVLPRR
ncbi:hypothetical protein QIH77_03260 [Bradyrhizobium diazoefficiens]|uniref:Uncharacterized protein n=1 Tax=Bradyrhizobium huanghuaihaiense TaxID=990078 RepID=A0A562RNC7_9BRAD|nr:MULTISPECIES: hypothetical protein [Bradyrhizobium]TWI70529.1 hypothetical protein IQ16_03702 [Bradyrhizobium huanghuaihaiense]WLA74266.1 hypothetical protein QIH77_03260 [Bradyrhizobium diazoefficiens]